MSAYTKTQISETSSCNKSVEEITEEELIAEDWK